MELHVLNAGAPPGKEVAIDSYAFRHWYQTLRTSLRMKHRKYVPGNDVPGNDVKLRPTCWEGYGSDQACKCKHLIPPSLVVLYWGRKTGMQRTSARQLSEPRNFTNTNP
ncbi:unnamed protein product [Leuciscus chuanchicus]